MNTGAEDVLVGCFNGGISTYETQREGRPYHRDCSCALHKSKDGKASSCFHHHKINVAVVMKKPWFKCSLSVETPKLLLFQRNKMENDAFKVGTLNQWMFM